MITKISESTRESYRTLFAQLSTLLMGYVETQTYTVPTADNPEVEYYYRENESSGMNYVFMKDETVSSIETFAEALNNHPLYVKAHKKDSTEGWTGEEIGFVDSSIDLANFSGITTVEEYLSWLAQLKSLNSDYVLRFSRMPLTEECFEIKANERTINIPTDFRKNGIGVQGDDVAEDVYFIIDRFFDIVDLNNCDIYVKWEAPKTKTKGVFEVLYRDITSEPGRIIFGWPITAKVASEAGSLKFSVQFIQRENPDDENSAIIYSLNTLTQTVTVQNSIGIDLSDPTTYEIDQIGTRLIDRIKFSEIVGGAKAATPEFIIEPEAKNYDLTDEVASIDLNALATSEDTGAISYTWYRAELSEGDKIKTDGAGHPVTGNVVESTLTSVKRDVNELEPGRVYYYYDDDNLSGNGTRYVVPASGDVGDLNQKIFVERVSTYTVNADKKPVTGAYYVAATNRITNSVGSCTSQKKAIFPKPLKPVFETIDKTNEGFFVEDADVELKVIAPHLDEEVQSYRWMFKANKEDEFEEIADATDQTYIVSKSEEGKGSGYYTVTVTNTRNTESLSTAGNEYGEIGENNFIVRVTNAPEIVTWEKVVPEVIRADGIDETSAFTARFVNIDDIEFDTISVGWFLYEPNVDGKDINEKIIDYTLISNPKENKDFSLIFNSEIQKKVKELTNNDLIAYYYPVVVNSINGREKYSDVPDDVGDMFQVTPQVVTQSLESSDNEDEVTVLSEDSEIDENSDHVTLNKLFFEE